MAMEYRDNARKPVLLEAKGLEFLKTAQSLEDQGVRVILLTHDELPVYEKILEADKAITEQDIENFFSRHTLEPSAVSPRMLRASAEVIVLLPEGLDRFPLRVKSRTVTGVKPLIDKIDEFGRRRRMTLAGQYHGTIANGPVSDRRGSGSEAASEASGEASVGSGRHRVQAGHDGGENGEGRGTRSASRAGTGEGGAREGNGRCAHRVSPEIGQQGMKIPPGAGSQSDARCRSSMVLTRIWSAMGLQTSMATNRP